VDDHPIVRRGLAMLIGTEKDLVVCGEADDAPAALEQVQKLLPDLAVIDLSLKASSGLELVKQVRTMCPDVKVLVFTMHDEPMYAERVLRAGAHGYVTKEEGAERALEAMRQLMQGRPFITGRLADALLTTLTGFGKGKGDSNLERLTDREFEVLGLIGNGLSSSEIAQRLKLSVKTIESHREHIKSKLGLQKANQLVQYAFNYVRSSQNI
jgi:DNA-binding NarL/FixJ family response regulator